uniref:Uncharacterized protein n=1 Tax=Brassica oleracea var. oleracea TaxID=109376 RepID=A0A0D3AH58_BRAOL
DGSSENRACRSEAQRPQGEELSLCLHRQKCSEDDREEGHGKGHMGVSEGKVSGQHTGEECTASEAEKKL